MNTKARLCVAACAAVVALAGCATNEQAGAVVGGVLGGAVGNQVGKGTGRTVATIAGTLAGAWIGSAIGRTMDEVDRMKVANALETQRTGATSAWRNPDTGTSYQVTPTRTYQRGSTPCREYTVLATIDGKAEKVTGTACRQPDGTWRHVD